jgi:hypothetical protein
VIVADVAWALDRHNRQVLQLTVDGHPAHIIPARQRDALLRRGIVEGIDTLTSDWLRNLTARPFIGGAVPPDLAGIPLAGCTDDPRVVTLYEDMCAAIADGSWRAGPRSAPPGSGELAQAPVDAAAARTHATEADHGA